MAIDNDFHDSRTRAQSNLKMWARILLVSTSISTCFGAAFSPAHAQSIEYHGNVSPTYPGSFNWDLGAGMLQLGWGGVESRVDILDGATIKAGSTLIGRAGTLTVSGPDSSLAIRDGLFVEEGVLNIRDGGKVISDGGGIGYGFDTYGTINISGAGSVWTSTIYIMLADEGGSGEINLSNGAKIVNDLFHVGLGRGSDGVGTFNIGGLDTPIEPGTLEPLTEALSTIVFQNQLGVINFNHTGLDYVFAPRMGSAQEGYGAINQKAGVTILTADNSVFKGTTTVSGGALVVGNSAGGKLGGTVVVETGGRLGGLGAVGDTTIASGGTLAPGNSVGGNTVASLTMNTGAIFEVEINGSGFDAGVNNDHTQVTGAATLADGAIIAVKSYPAGKDGSPYAAGRYTILDAGTLVIQGDLVVEDNFAFLDFTIGNDTTSLWLDSQLAAPTFCLAGSSANQCATGDGIFSLGAPNGLYLQMLGMSDAQVLAAQNMLSGEIHASIKGAMLEDSRFVREAATARIRAAFDTVGAAASLPVMAYGEGGPRPAPATANGLALWTQGFGAWGSFDGDGNAAGLDHRTGGFLIGGDVPVGGWRLGALAGYSHSAFEVDDRASSASSDNIHLGLYGGTQWSKLGFRTGAAYSWHAIRTNRSVAFGGFADTPGGDYDAGAFQAFGELGYRIDTPSASFEPFANLAYVNLHTAGFTEKGGAAALSVGSATTDTTFTTLGVRASTKLGLGGMKATARGMLGWRHAFGDTRPSVSNAFAGGNAFTVAGVPIAKDTAVLEAGLDFAVSDNAMLGISYAGQFGDGARDHGAKADFSVRF